jgi:hypothetical protein
MLKKILLAGFVLFTCNTVLSLFSSCERKRNTVAVDQCSVPACFSYNNADVIIYNSVTHESSPDAIKGKELAFRVVLEGSTSVCYNERPGKWYEHLSLISTAHAFAGPMPCPIRLQGDSVIAYNIYSDKDYDQEHPAGTSLNDIITTDDVPSPPHKGQYNSYNPLVLEFMVNKSPVVGYYYHTFTIALSQEDGDVVTVSTPPILVRN